MAGTDFAQIVVQAPAGVNLAPATQVVDAIGIPCLLYNTSTTVTVYLTRDNAYTSLDTGSLNVTPLGPLQSVVFEGDIDVFAVVGPGQSATVNCYPDASNFTPYTIITPLAQQGGLPPAGSAFNVPAAGTVNITTLADVSLYSAYDISIYAFCTQQGVTGASLTMPVTFTWYDDLVSGVSVYTEEWDVWVSTNNGSGVYPKGTAFGTGPMHGRYLTVSVAELGGAEPITIQYVNIFASNRSVTRSNWRQAPGAMASNGITFWTTGVGPDDNLTINNVLGTVSAGSVPAASTVWFPFGLYSGQVWWRFQAGAALANDACLDLCDPRIIQSGSISPGTGGQVVLNNIGTATNETEVQLLLPRCPAYIVFHNSSASAVGIQMGLFAQEVS